MSMASYLSVAQETNPFPWDFPQVLEIKAEPGQWVLSCYTFYPKALKDNKKVDDANLIFYSTKMTEVGKSKSKLNGKVEVKSIAEVTKALVGN